MISVRTVRNVFGILGNIISFCMFLSPLPTFVKIWKKGSVEQYSPVPYLATLLNCMTWVLYGMPMVHPNSTLVVTTNGIGMAIELVYLFLFVLYSDNKKRLKVLLGFVLELIFIAVLATLVLTVAHTTKIRTSIVGTVCIVLNLMMYAAPLSIMRMVITTKSVEYMPFYLSLASFGNGVAWTIPNGLGTLLAVAQLILYGIYYKPTQRMLAERKANAEVGLSQIVVNGNAKNKGNATANHNGRNTQINQAQNQAA